MSRLKHRLARLLRRPGVNRLVSPLLRPVARRLPEEAAGRIPWIGTVEVRLPRGQLLRLDSDGRDLIAATLHWHGLEGYEPETFRLLHRLLADVRVFFDVGASTGLYTLIAALEDPARRVFAFEPSPDMFSHLERNLRLNAVANVVPVAAAVGESDGAATLFVPPGESLPFGASTRRSHREPGTALPVRALRLDTFAGQESVARVDLVKMDTEGTEPSVLAGARQLLERDEPWILCEVLHGLTEAALHAELDRLRYRYFAVTPHGLEERQRIVGDPGYRQRNWLFATDRRLRALPLDTHGAGTARPGHAGASA